MNDELKTGDRGKPRNARSSRSSVHPLSFKLHPFLSVLWSDADFVAIFKPSGLASIPGRGESRDALGLLAAQLGLPASGTVDPRLRVVHRLDKDTSGLLIFAKRVGAQRMLSHQFQNNQVEKEYLALVRGRPETQEGEIDAPIGVHPGSTRRMAVLTHGGRPARTIWKLEESFRDFSLLRVFPKTGKTHQIRVHLKSIGLPLAIDPLYQRVPPHVPAGIFLSSFKRGYRAAEQEERPLIDRLTLHAERLRFFDASGAPRSLESPLSKDFRAVLNMLRRYGGR